MPACPWGRAGSPRALLGAAPGLKPGQGGWPGTREDQAGSWGGEGGPAGRAGGLGCFWLYQAQLAPAAQLGTAWRGRGRQCQAAATLRPSGRDLSFWGDRLLSPDSGPSDCCPLPAAVTCPSHREYRGCGPAEEPTCKSRSVSGGCTGWRGPPGRAPGQPSLCLELQHARSPAVCTLTS